MAQGILMLRHFSLIKFLFLLRLTAFFKIHSLPELKIQFYSILLSKFIEASRAIQTHTAPHPYAITDSAVLSQQSKNF